MEENRRNTIGNSKVTHNVSDKVKFKLLYKRIVDRYETITSFCSTVGISYTNLWKKLAGIRVITLAEALKWSEALDIEPQEFERFFGKHHG